MSATAAKTIEIGQELPGLVKEVTQRQIDAYSGVRPHSIHTDEAWAKQKGFRGTLAQGMMSTAYISELMMNLLGEGFAQGGKMAVTFIKPVFSGDRVAVGGVVKDQIPENGRRRIVVEVWCKNQHGETVTVGTASGLAY